MSAQTLGHCQTKVAAIGCRGRPPAVARRRPCVRGRFRSTDLRHRLLEVTSQKLVPHRVRWPCALLAGYTGGAGPPSAEWSKLQGAKAYFLSGRPSRKLRAQCAGRARLAIRIGTRIDFGDPALEAPARQWRRHENPDLSQDDLIKNGSECGEGPFRYKQIGQVLPRSPPR
jgi:hypothetical protein